MIAAVDWNLLSPDDCLRSIDTEVLILVQSIGSSSRLELQSIALLVRSIDSSSRLELVVSSRLPSIRLIGVVLVRSIGCLVLKISRGIR